MFTNLFFLFLFILLVSFVPQVEPNNTLEAGIFLYGLTLLLIYTERFSSLVFTNIQLMVFFILFYYILEVQGNLPNSNTLLILFSVAMYFGGLAVHHLRSRSVSFTVRQLKFLFPFTIPLTFLSLIVDLGSNGLVLLSLVAIVVFFPAILQFFWGCHPIANEALRLRLESFCKRLNFRHSGIKTWEVMKHALTAGILGVIPRFRYVIFTDRILHELSPECLEAILAHEIGHSKKFHLIFYPFIITGISAIGAIVFILLDNRVSSPLLILLIFGIIAAIYFRVVFGYFSRLFERQADLFIFEAGVSHIHMIEALDHIGVETGNSHLVPNWHHYSIQERIDYLNDAAIDRNLIEKHNQWVKWSLIAYFIFFTIGSIYIYGAL